MEDNQIDMHELRIISYNCRGFNDVKGQYLTRLLSQADIIFLQEHWLSTSVEVVGDGNTPSSLNDATRSIVLSLITVRGGGLKRAGLNFSDCASCCSLS
jgi:hypothetical protein